MINAIVGAKGDIAKNLLFPLLKQLGSINLVDKDSSSKAWGKIWKSDVIWLAVPRDTIPGIIKDVRLSSDQLIIDVCSIKRCLSQVIKTTGAVHLSLHPLHGPHIPLNGQRWVVINNNAAKKNKKIQRVLSFLKGQGISFIQAQSEDEHDFMMGITLSMPELLTIVIASLLSQYSKDCGQEKPDMEKLMEWAVPASNALFSAYIHAINSSADWLRKDLLLGAYGNLVESAKKTFESLSKITADEIAEKLSKQKGFVESLPLEERKRTRQWIERWFVDSTQKIFSFHKKSE